MFSPRIINSIDLTFFTYFITSFFFFLLISYQFLSVSYLFQLMFGYRNSIFILLNCTFHVTEIHGFKQNRQARAGFSEISSWRRPDIAHELKKTLKKKKKNTYVRLYGGSPIKYSRYLQRFRVSRK